MSTPPPFAKKRANGTPPNPGGEFLQHPPKKYSCQPEPHFSAHRVDRFDPDFSGIAGFLQAEASYLSAHIVVFQFDIALCVENYCGKTLTLFFAHQIFQQPVIR